MTRIVLIGLLIIYTALGYGQNRYFTKTGHIGFISRTPFIDLEADNNMVISFIDIKTGDLLFAAVMKAFKFKQALAEEHFNENYVESDKFPQAKFKGKILNWKEPYAAKDGNFDVIVEGDLTIHGVTQKVKVPGKIEFKSGKIYASSAFVLHPADFDIKIPSIVKEKIAENIETYIEMVYEPYVQE